MRIPLVSWWAKLYTTLDEHLYCLRVCLQGATAYSKIFIPLCDVFLHVTLNLNFPYQLMQWSTPLYYVLFCSGLRQLRLHFCFILSSAVCLQFRLLCGYMRSYTTVQLLYQMITASKFTETSDLSPRSRRTACCSVLQRESSQVRVAGSRIPGESVCSDEEFLYKVLKREIASWPLSKIITHLTCSLLLPSLLGFGTITSPSS